MVSSFLDGLDCKQLLLGPPRIISFTSLTPHDFDTCESEILRVNDGRFKERLLQLLHNVEGDDSDDEPVDDSDEDPNYVVSDNELNQSESDDSFAVDEPQLEDEDDPL
ncbi:hypothetical protein J6590_079236 [Homalodisca vitripennis]|nr:hypothetical protein J6590_079236 [Homalodisca vitripennis]